MYAPAKFRIENQEQLAGFIQEYSFATLVSTPADGEVVVSHVPLVLNTTAPSWTLLGHVARVNPHWRHFDGKTPCLAIFQGPHAYISPTWYATGPAVPTWNYAVVHVSGKPSVLDDSESARALETLVEQHEAHRSPRWRATDTPADFQSKLRQAIVPFSMTVDSVQGVFKASQNRSEADRAGVLEGLAGDGAAASEFARFMREHS